MWIKQSGYWKHIGNGVMLGCGQKTALKKHIYWGRPWWYARWELSIGWGYDPKSQYRFFPWKHGLTFTAPEIWLKLPRFRSLRATYRLR